MRQSVITLWRSFNACKYPKAGIDIDNSKRHSREGATQAVNFRAALGTKKLSCLCWYHNRENSAFSRGNLCVLAGFNFCTWGFRYDPWMGKALTVQLRSPVPPCTNHFCPLMLQRKLQNEGRMKSHPQSSETASCFSALSLKLQFFKADLALNHLPLS